MIGCNPVDRRDDVAVACRAVAVIEANAMDSCRSSNPILGASGDACDGGLVVVAWVAGRVSRIPGPGSNYSSPEVRVGRVGRVYTIAQYVNIDPEPVLV
jgi:hypothetical protein